MRRARRPKQAAPAFQRAAERAPWKPEPHLNLARSYDALGRHGEAAVEHGKFQQLREIQQRVDVAEIAATVNPGDATLLIDLGLAYAEQEQLAQARRQFERALELEPHNKEAKRERQRVVERSKRTR